MKSYWRTKLSAVYKPVVSTGRLSHCIRRHPIIGFPLVYLGWAYAFWIPVLLSDRSVWELPSLSWFLIGGASPLIAGVLLAFGDGGRAQLRDLFRRLADWRRISFTWLLSILSFWLLFDLVMAGAAVFLGVTDSPLDINWSLWLNPEALLFLILLSFVFPAIEEVGLRGYYLDTLQKNLTPVAAAAVNGIVWAIWHTPFVWFPGYYAYTSFHPALFWWLPMIICHALLIAYVYCHTGRSILAALIFHGMMNFTGEWLRISADMYPFMLSGNVLMALFVVSVWHRSAGSGSNNTQGALSTERSGNKEG